MNFLKTIQDSIYSPEFYSNITKKSFKSSFGYFFLVILLLTVIHLITLIPPLLIEAPRQLQEFAADVINCYPKDLEIKINNGQVSINAEEPYFISCEGLDGLKEQESLVVIDTKTSFSQSQFDEYNVAAWITKDSVFYKKNNYETRSYSFKQIKDFKLNKEFLVILSGNFTPWIKFVGPILLILAFLGIYLSYIFRLIQLLVVAAFILVLGKIFKQNRGFRESYKLGLYAITLGLIVDLVVSLTSKFTYFHGFPFMVTIITLIVVVVNIFLPKKTS